MFHINPLGLCEVLARCVDVLLAERVHDVGPLEQPSLLLRCQAVLDVAILEDLREVAAAPVLARHVRDDLLLRRAAGEEEGERITKHACQPVHGGDCIVVAVQVPSDRGRFAERELHGVDDAGREERIVVWIERKAGALWAVGRVVNPHLRNGNAMKASDYVFEGYELEDALEQANAALEDDLTVSEKDGRSEHCRPFTREECLKPLEAWFFGRSA
jgi:hypothetical protein